MKTTSLTITTAYIVASIQGSRSFTPISNTNNNNRLRVNHRQYERQHHHIITAKGQNDDNDDNDDTNTKTNTKTDTNGSNADEFNQLKITFVTGNKMKARELNLILAEEQATKGPNPETSLVDLKIVNVDLPEIQEVSTEAIAKSKAILAAQLAGGPCVVEDTSLEFNALGGMPGPYIKWFQQKLQSEGLYNLLTAYEDKSAVCVCTLAFCPYPHADPVLFTGRTHGTIVKPVPGHGFGWDSIFVPDDGEDDTPFSMMSTEEKNQLSHRGEAVRKWAKWLGMNQMELWERQGGRPAIGHKGLDFKITSTEE